MIEIGTRTRNNTLQIEPPQGTITRTFNNDLGMSKRENVSVTFAAGPPGTVTGANGTFAAFGLFDVVQVENTNLNNGFFTVVGTDGLFQSYLYLSPPPNAEAAVSAIIRTA